MSEVTRNEATEPTMTCPKCGGEMHTVERNGVTIEQCRKCHGIFLDRGEFEQLLTRETSYLGNGESLPGQGVAGSGRAARWKKPWRR
jgi:Zn-finger nucleic acid-binding protein